MLFLLRLTVGPDWDSRIFIQVCKKNGMEIRAQGVYQLELAVFLLFLLFLLISIIEEESLVEQCAILLNQFNPSDDIDDFPVFMKNTIINIGTVASLPQVPDAFF